MARYPRRLPVPVDALVVTLLLPIQAVAAGPTALIARQADQTAKRGLIVGRVELALAAAVSMALGPSLLVDDLRGAGARLAFVVDALLAVVFDGLSGVMGVFEVLDLGAVVAEVEERPLRDNVLCEMVSVSTIQSRPSASTSWPRTCAPRRSRRGAHRPGSAPGSVARRG